MMDVGGFFLDFEAVRTAVGTTRSRRVRRTAHGPEARARSRPTRPSTTVGLLFPPKDALEDDEHPWWYMTAQ